MTSDFLDDAVDALELEEAAYLIVVQSPGGCAARVLCNLKEGRWKPSHPSLSVKDDILQLLGVSAFAE